MTKKFLCVLFSLFTVLNTFAYDFMVDGLAYDKTSETTVKVAAQTVGVDNYANLTNCAIPSAISYNGVKYRVTGIAYNAFNNVAGLVSVTIPATIVTMEEKEGHEPVFESNAFYNTPKLEKIIVDKDNSNYVSVDGVLFNKAKTFLIVYPTSKMGTFYSIPDGVEKIGIYAFNNCALTGVVLPRTLQMLGYYAFINCTKLSKIVCYAATPPVETTAQTESWNFVNVSTETLYVPADAVETYKSDNLWGVFKDKILPIPEVKLDETNANITTQLEGLNGQIVDAKLIRSFDADGAWYTLCLPFSLTEQQIAESLGEGCALMKLDYAQRRSSEDLYIHFASATTLEAGIPYLFRPANNITNPVFRGVAIEYQADKENTIATPYKLVSMTGIYAPAQVPDGKWYLGPNNTLYQPQEKVTSKGFRAYFTLSTSLPSNIRARVVMNNEMPTDVDDIQGNMDSVPLKVLENGQVYILRGGHKYNLQGQVVE